MASFLDQIPTFNPYVQQLPVEEMFAVGTAKQEKYNEGIQKIQGQIDTVAGIDVVRDIDKSYLQAKLNGLGNNLKTLAANDFSTFQLQNSVSGMVSNIVKDENVVNALISTQRYRKGVAEMETAIKEGKSSPSNEWMFQKQASEWLNSEDVKQPFSGRYQPYTNYKKNALEVLKSLTKNSSITEDAFTLDSKGNMVIADATVKKQIAGITPEQIQQALMATLTPADFQQMEIDGRYQYSNISDEEFVQRINSSYEKDYTHYKRTRDLLEGGIDSTTSIPEKQALRAQINSIDKYLDQLGSEYQNISGTFGSGDTESAKARLHTKNFIDQFGKAFSHTETSTTYETSPFAEAQRWRENLGWEKWKYKDSQAFQDKWKTLEYNQKQQEIDIKALEAQGLNGATSLVDQAIPQDQLPQIDLHTFSSTIEADEQSIVNSDREFIKKRNGVKQVTDQDQEWILQQYEKYVQSPSSVEADLRRYFQNTESLRTKVKSDRALKDEIDATLTEEFPEINLNIPIEGISFTLRGPQGSYNVSPKELAVFNGKKSKYIQYVSGVVGMGGMKSGVQLKFNDEAARKELNNKEYKLYEIHKKSLNNQALNPGEEELINESQRINTEVGELQRNAYKNANKRGTELLQERLTSTQGTARAIPMGNAVQRDQIRGFLTSVLQIANNNDGELANSDNFDAEALLKVMQGTDMSATITSTERTELQEPIHTVTVVGDGVQTSFTITDQQKRSAFPGRFEIDQRIGAISPYLDQIRKTGGVSTSYSGSAKSSHSNAYLQAPKFPNVRIYGINGDLVTLDGANVGDKYYDVKLNIYDPIKKEWIDNVNLFDEAIPAENVAQVMASLSDVVIFNKLYGRNPTQQELKQIEDASKKPF